MSRKLKKPMRKLKHILAIVPVGFLSETPRAFHIGNLAAAILRALTPKNIRISLVDENLGGEIDFNSDADLVLLLSVITSAAPKAYRIAHIFKKKGKVVGIGGPHPSVAPQEALEFADFVGVGEFEGYWHKILEDFEKNKLKKIYKNEKPVILDNMPRPDRRILRNMKAKGHKRNYLTTNITYTTRGCPYNCAFCTVTNIYGAKYRFRPVKQVVDDLLKYGGKKLNFVAFLDDNIWAVPQYAKRLFREMIKRKLNKKWMSQASLTQASDLELLRLAKKAGCSSLFIGYESITLESLNEARKHINKPEQFKELTRNLQRAGIPIVGSFVIGFDSDTIESIKQTVEFAIDSKIDYAQFNILTPFKNTALYNKLEKENRIILKGEGGGKFHDNWSFYSFSDVIYKPKKISAKQLKNLSIWAYQRFYSFGPGMKRVFNSLKCYPFLAPFFLAFNLLMSRYATKIPLDSREQLKINIKKWEKENSEILHYL